MSDEEKIKNMSLGKLITKSSAILFLITLITTGGVKVVSQLLSLLNANDDPILNIFDQDSDSFISSDVSRAILMSSPNIGDLPSFLGYDVRDDGLFFIRSNSFEIELINTSSGSIRNLELRNPDFVFLSPVFITENIIGFLERRRGSIDNDTNIIIYDINTSTRIDSINLRDTSLWEMSYSNNSFFTIGFQGNHENSQVFVSLIDNSGNEVFSEEENFNYTLENPSSSPSGNSLSYLRVNNGQGLPDTVVLRNREGEVIGEFTGNRQDTFLRFALIDDTSGVLFVRAIDPNNPLQTKYTFYLINFNGEGDGIVSTIGALP
ncbi:MAG: hypothetical protein ABI721_03585 [Candidatus Dojkabacteria bacterium]